MHTRRYRPFRRPLLERLEDRLAPAFNLVISGTAEFTDNVARPAPGQYVAAGPGAILQLFDVVTDLKAGLPVRISTGSAGSEPGHVTWQAFQSLGDLDINGLGAGRLTIETAGDVTLLSRVFDSDPGDDGLDLTVRASGDLHVAADLRVGPGVVELSADVLAGDSGDDGNGTLTVAAGVTVAAGDARLRGADIQIDGSVSAAFPPEPPTLVADGFSGSDFQGLAFDATGNLYVADFTNNRVHRVTPAGAVSTFATGFNRPAGLAFDAAGNLYVANFFGNSVSKVTPAGQVSTFAAGLGQPVGLAFDVAGNLYVADILTSSVSKVTPAGQVSTFASGLGAPRGLAFDAAGNLYVAESVAQRNRVSRVTPAGEVTVFAAGLNTPTGLAFDAEGNLYVGNQNGGDVVRIEPDGFATSLARLGSPLAAGLSMVATAPGSLFVSFGGTVRRLGTATLSVKVRTSLPTTDVRVGDGSPAAGLRLDSGELARLAAPGGLTVGDRTHAGTITFSGADLRGVTAGRALVVQDPAGAGRVVLETGPAPAITASGIVSLAAGTAGILTVHAAGGTDIATAGAVSLRTAGPVGAAASPVRLGAGASVSVAAASVVFLEGLGNLSVSVAAASAVFVTGPGDLTVGEARAAGAVVLRAAEIRLAGPVTAGSVDAAAVGGVTLTAPVVSAGEVVIRAAEIRLAGPVTAGSVDVAALGGVTLTAPVVSAGAVSLAADTRPDGQGDDGTGSLVVSAVAGSAVTLAGADLVLNAAVSGASIRVRPSLPTLPINVGTEPRPGLTLDRDEAARLVATDSFLVGGAAQLGDIVFGQVAISASLVRVEQSPAGPGRILLLQPEAIRAGGTLLLAAGAGGVEADVPGAGLAAATLLLETPGDVGLPVRPLFVDAPALGAGRVGGALFLVALDDLTTAGALSVGRAAELTLTGDFVTLAGHLVAPAINLSFIGSDIQRLESGGQAFRSLVHAGPGPLQLAGPLTLTGSLVNISGRLDADNVTVSVAGLTSILGGEYVASERRAHTFTGGLLIEGAFDADEGQVTAGSLTLGAGAVLNAIDALLTVTGDWTNLGGDFLSDRSTVVFAGPGSHRLVTRGAAFHNLSHLGGVLAVADNLTLTGGFTHGPAAGAVNIIGRTVRVAGDWVWAGRAPLLSAGSSVVLTGANQRVIGSVTFFHLTKVVGTAATLTVQAGATITVNGAVTLRGARGAPLTLRSSAPGVRWRLLARGPRNLAFLDVRDSLNLHPAALVAALSRNGGNALGWRFA